MRRLLPFLSLLALSPGVNAQSDDDWGIYSGGECMNGKDMVITANPNSTYTLTSVLLPVDSLEVTWTATGGVEIVAQNANSVTFKSKSGDSYRTLYSRYSPGIIYLDVKFPRTLPEGCDDCTLASSFKNRRLSQEVTIYKSFDYSGNEIIGPSCISANDSVTFSVAPWVSLLWHGYDQYKWTIPDALRKSELYYSSDKSSVTFVASENIEGQTVKCEIGMYNFGKQKPLSFSLSADSPEPIIEGLTDGSSCIPVSNDTITFRVANAVAGNTYVWNIRPWRILSTSKSGAELTFVPTDNVKNWLYLTVSGGCKEKTYQYEVGRSFSSDSYIEAVGYDDCIPAGREVRFRVSDATQGVDVRWSASGAGWFLNDGDTILPQPYITSGVEQGIVTVESYMCPGSSLSRTFSIAPDAPSAIDGDKCLSPGVSETKTYSVPAVANADSYEWRYPAGWEALGNSNGNSISLKTAANVGGLLKVRALGCDTSDWFVDTVKVQRQRINDILVSGCLNIGTTGYATLYLSGHSEDDFYEWDIPSEFASNHWFLTQNHDSVRVYYRGNPGVYPVTVRPSYSCGDAGAVTKAIEVTTSASLSKTVNARKQLVIALDDDTFDDTSIAIAWYVGSRNGTPVSVDEQSIRLKPTDDYYNSGTAWCKLTYETGCITWLSISWNSSDFASVNKSLSFDLDVDVTSDANEVSVTMNDDPDGAVLTVYSNDGVVVDSRSLEHRTANVSLSSLRKGIYVFNVTSPKGQYSFKRIWRGNK